MSNEDEYGVSKEDLEGGSNGGAKPRGKYTGSISRAKSKTDRNGLICLQFGISITKGKFKKALLFENYLPLSKRANSFQVARRNSFLRAIGADGGQTPPGAPGGPVPAVLDGTIVDVIVEHEYENVPGEEYSLTTGSYAKSPWVTGGWEKRLDEKGRLTHDAEGNVILGENGEPEPIEPRESLSFYNVSDDFDGLGNPEGTADDSAPSQPAQADKAASEDSWG